MVGMTKNSRLLEQEEEGPVSPVPQPRQRIEHEGLPPKQPGELTPVVVQVDFQQVMEQID